MERGDTEVQADAPPAGAFSAVREAVFGALQVAEASLVLLRAELRLARSSALNLVWLGFALIFLGVGAWVATSAALAAGIYQLTGNIFVGIASVAVANGLGIVAVLVAMKRSWRDLGLPRTRELVLGMRQPPPAAAATTSSPAGDDGETH